MVEKSSHTALSAPLSFIPYLKEVVWGGDRLCRFKGMEPVRRSIGESWEICGLPGYESVVAAGPLAGLSLNELIERYGAALLGTRVAEEYGDFFPLLFKFIDADRDLSVQVHPTDDISLERHGLPGKDEMWYMISCRPGSKVYAGFNRMLESGAYTAAVDNGSIASMINSFETCTGDVFFLEAGLVHAIGAGNLLAEVQVASDITYRIFDYNRPDTDGKPRPLHTHLAKNAIDFGSQPLHRSFGHTASESEQVIAESRHFTVRRMSIDGEAAVPHTAESFTVLMCVEGECSVGSTPLAKGHTVLLPAAMESPVVKGKAILLHTCCCTDKK